VQRRVEHREGRTLAGTVERPTRSASVTSFHVRARECP
jgi:hypothetical protein